MIVFNTFSRILNWIRPASTIEQGYAFAKRSFETLSGWLHSLRTASLQSRTVEVLFKSDLADEEIEEHFSTDFLRRLKPHERRRLLNSGACLCPADPVAVLAMKKNDFEHSFFQSPNWEVVVFQAYMHKQIDEFTASRLFLYQSCLKSKKPMSIHCGDLDKLISALLDLEGADFVTDLTQRLENLPEEDRVFFSIQTPLLSLSEAQRAIQNKNIDIANFALYFNFYVGFIVDGENRVVEELIIPPRLWQEILYAKFGERAVEIRPVLGYFKKEKMSDPHFRVTAVPCSWAELPETIHDLIDPGQGPAFYQHDAQYHTSIESANPHRAIWVQLALHLKEKGFQDAFIELLDRNFPSYLERFTSLVPISPEKAFWVSLAQFIKQFPGVQAEMISEIHKNAKSWSDIDLSLETLLEINRGWPKTRMELELQPQLEQILKTYAELTGDLNLS